MTDSDVFMRDRLINRLERMDKDHCFIAPGIDQSPRIVRAWHSE